MEGQMSVYDINYFKELHVGHKIIYYLLDENEFVFRTLTRKEYNDIANIVNTDEEFEDAVCQIGLLYPEDYAFANSPYAGISTKVSAIITQESGFQDLDYVLGKFEDAKDKISQFDEQCMLVVKAAMPEYTFDEMEDWTWDRLMEMTSRGEAILKLKGFDIEIKSNKEAIEERLEYEEENRDEFVKELIENGIDPMLYYEEEFTHKSNYIDEPLIGGTYWNNEGILSEIRRQMEKAT